MLRTLIVFIVLIYSFLGMAQRTPNRLVISGTVLGYTYDGSKSLFKKKKATEIEGSITGVNLLVKKGNAEVSSSETGLGGEFDLSLEIGSKYLITYTKSGYGTSAFEVDLMTIPTNYSEKGLVLENIQLILNDYESDKPQDNGGSLGCVRFNEKHEKFEFEPTQYEQKKRLFKNQEDNTPLNLMLNSIGKNAEKNTLFAIELDIETPNTTRRYSSRSGELVEEDSLLLDSTGFSVHQQKLNEVELTEGNDLLTKEGIAAFEKQIEEERAQLEIDKSQAITELDFFSIAAREKLLASAERELETAKAYIAEQEAKLAAKSNLISALIGLGILLAILLGLVVVGYFIKKKHNHVLATKNKKITDGINYAVKIQESVLLSQNQIHEIFPKHCLYYQPLDQVSGDFYWFSKVGNEAIVAAIDCTGHGVPGAFMSLIGNTLMNQIVNEKGITKPKEILRQLHDGVVNALQQYEGEAAQDGMDASVCTINLTTKELKFCGALNEAYLVRNGQVETLIANLFSIGGTERRGDRLKLKQHKLTLAEGDRIYLFSDGYMDQFGGANDEKMNISRFKALLSNLSTVSMNNQKQEFENTLNNWRGNTPQTDDVLVIGVEV